MTASAEVSHGRGGAGNMHQDDTQYVDGSVVRSGVEGSHGDGAYSAGRGGEFTRGRWSPSLPIGVECLLGGSVLISALSGFLIFTTSPITGASELESWLFLQDGRGGFIR